MRIWENSNKEERRQNFLTSHYYEEFHANTHATATSVGVWCDVLKRVGWFVTNPTHKSCINEKISSFEHLNRALAKVMQNKKSQLETYSGVGLMLEETLQAVKQGTAYSLVDAVCCEKEVRHDIHIDKDKTNPRFLKFECTHSN